MPTWGEPMRAIFIGLFLNPGHEHHWLKLRLHGVHSNRMGVGSRVSVRLTDLSATGWCAP